MPFKVTIRSMQGEQNVETELNGDSLTVSELREIADLVPGLSLRRGGAALSDSDSVTSGETLVATTPEAKHG
jgi:hypothetical protein